MRIFVYEYLSTGALPEADSLLREGFAMLAAVVADLAVSQEVVTMVAPSLLDRVKGRNIEAHVVTPSQEESTFRDLIWGCNAALIIAPEFDDILAQRAEWVLDASVRLLGPTPQGIRLCADKLILAEHLMREGLPTPPTAIYHPAQCPFDYPVVVKPRDGAGALETYLVWKKEEYASVGGSGARIVQPYCAGEVYRTGSVSLLVKGFDVVALLPGEQVTSLAVSRSLARRERETASDDVPASVSQFHYHGGHIPIAQHYHHDMIDLATRAVRSVPGLQGYVGVDLILTDPPMLLEINPRLTTSYIGLRQLARFNIMQAMLDVLEGRSPGVLEYHPGEVSFHPGG